jgi:Domain of unknown function (DUF1844)
MTDEKKSYTVTDRRHSTVEGEAAVADGPSGPDVPADSGQGEASDATVGSSPAPVDFTTFIMSLGQQAAMLLGGVQGQPDLQGAKWFVSILEMLRDKTEGRRTPEETEALESILYELRMVYLQRSRAGA